MLFVIVISIQSLVSLLSLCFQAEKFGDSFVFEGILSESVKNQITQAVSISVAANELHFIISVSLILLMQILKKKKEKRLNKTGYHF